jgi:hypothetical protein
MGRNNELHNCFSMFQCPNQNKPITFPYANFGNERGDSDRSKAVLKRPARLADEELAGLCPITNGQGPQVSGNLYPTITRGDVMSYRPFGRRRYKHTAYDRHIAINRAALTGVGLSQRVVRPVDEEPTF